MRSRDAVGIPAVHGREDVNQRLGWRNTRDACVAGLRDAGQKKAAKRKPLSSRVAFFKASLDESDLNQPTKK